MSRSRHSPLQQTQSGGSRVTSEKGFNSDVTSRDAFHPKSPCVLTFPNRQPGKCLRNKSGRLASILLSKEKHHRTRNFGLELHATWTARQIGMPIANKVFAQNSAKGWRRERILCAAAAKLRLSQEQRRHKRDSVTGSTSRISFSSSILK